MVSLSVLTFPHEACLNFLLVSLTPFFFEDFSIKNFDELSVGDRKRPLGINHFLIMATFPQCLNFSFMLSKLN